jgi:hypothetical protein
MAPSKFDVIVWVRKTDTFPALRNELLRLAGNEPDESTRIVKKSICSALPIYPASRW